MARIARLVDVESCNWSDVSYTLMANMRVELSLVWREIDVAFESCILTGAMINSNHIEPRRFLDAGNVVLERVRDAVERHGSVKVNTAFNEFATKEKRANKCIIIKNSKLYHCTNMRE